MKDCNVKWYKHKKINTAVCIVMLMMNIIHTADSSPTIYGGGGSLGGCFVAVV